MSEIKVASRYAKSLIDLANENDALEQVKGDMFLFEQVVGGNSELEAILNNPIVPLDKKTGILSGIFDAKVSPITKSFFKLIVEKGRSEILFATSKQFIIQYNAIKGIVTANVTSAIALDSDSISEIERIVKRELGANEVVIKGKVDNKLIGGFIIKVGDKQFDASISNGLNKLRKEFLHN